MLTQPDNPKRRGAILVVVLVVLALGLGFVAWLKSPQGDDRSGRQTVPETSDNVACTLEAKICPDGSAVGRQGPDCEFAPCPEELGIGSEASPETVMPQFSAAYITAEQWPPALSSVPGKLACKETPAEISQMTQRVAKRDIGGREYCITITSEGAAGSVYSDYTYSFQDGNNVTSLRFVLRFPECTNYEDLARQQCQQEREAFDLDSLVASVAAAVR